MTVKDLIKSLEKCNPDCEVYFEETQTKVEDGITVGVESVVNSVYELAVRENDLKPYAPERVLLSNEKEVEDGERNSDNPVSLRNES